MTEWTAVWCNTAGRIREAASTSAHGAMRLVETDYWEATNRMVGRVWHDGELFREATVLPSGALEWRKPASEAERVAAFRELVERSSFGTPAAKALRRRTSDETAARIVARVDELARPR